MIGARLHRQALTTGALLACIAPSAMPAVGQVSASRSMGNADPARNAVLDARDDGVRVEPPIRLYPSGHAGFENWPGKLTGAAEVVRDDTVFNVVDPSFQAFLPPRDRSSRTAVIIAPGGGFRQLSIASEGNDVARWLAARGIAAFVLKYRIVQQRGPDYSMAARFGEFGFDVAGTPGVADGTEAIRQIRARAGAFNIDPHKIVFMGFSAGAHVASYQALNTPVPDRPDYVAAIYGAPLEAAPELPPRYLPGTMKPGAMMGPVKLPDSGTPNPAALPPIFLAGSQDDFLVGDKTKRFYDALLAAGYTPEAHFYVNGLHGYGMTESNSSSRHFVEEFYWWLETLGLTRKPGDADRASRPGALPFALPQTK